MKILVTVDPEIPVPPGLYGGIERIVEALVHGLIDRGHEVTLCANPASEMPCEVIGWKGATSRHIPDIIRNLATLTRLVYTRKYDIVHSFSRLAYMTVVMPLNIPKIMSYQREPSLVQIGKAARLAKKNSMVFTGCSDYITNQIKTVAEAYTIYNCAPFERYTATRNILPDAPLVFLGRIEDIKGAHVAVAVARKLNKRLIIAGNIPEDKMPYFEEQIAPYLNDRIVYAGPVNDEQKNEILGQALAFLMPIQWNEPFGIVMAEAMACGTPVLGFPKGSVPEVVEEGITGYICADADDMAEKAKRCETLDRMTVRAVAEKRFSSNKIVSDYLELYNHLISR
jgi:glycosyltransferase involved in cell wall biosynthesis